MKRHRSRLAASSKLLASLEKKRRTLEAQYRKAIRELRRAS